MIRSRRNVNLVKRGGEAKQNKVIITVIEPDNKIHDAIVILKPIL